MSHARACSCEGGSGFQLQFSIQDFCAWHRGVVPMCFPSFCRVSTRSAEASPHQPNILIKLRFLLSLFCHESGHHSRDHGWGDDSCPKKQNKHQELTTWVDLDMVLHIAYSFQRTGDVIFPWEIWYINQELEAMGEERRKSQQFMAKLQLSVCTSQLHQTSLFSETAASNSILLSCFCDFYLGLLLLMWLICPLSYNQPLASISTTCFLLEDLFLFAS